MSVKPKVNFFRSFSLGARRSFFINSYSTKILENRYGIAVKIPPNSVGKRAASTPTMRVIIKHKIKNHKKYRLKEVIKLIQKTKYTDSIENISIFFKFYVNQLKLVVVIYA